MDFHSNHSIFYSSKMIDLYILEEYLNMNFIYFSFWREYEKKMVEVDICETFGINNIINPMKTTFVSH
jgi:hypothetical protein